MIVFGLIFLLAGVLYFLDKPQKYKSHESYIAKEPKIFLYGEYHGLEEFYTIENQIWEEKYKEGFRNLFIEDSYCGAEFLNLWMKEDNDKILDKLYVELEGTQAQTPYTLDFYKRIKKNCPETVFYGTDIGHQYYSTGKRYIEYLEKNGLSNTKEYKLAVENNNQGKEFYKKQDDAYREAKMIENFIRAYEEVKMKGQDKVMGIYGSYHTDPRKTNFGVDSMAKGLKNYYGDIVNAEDIANLLE